MNPAGGQFGSLEDMIILTQTLLNPRHPKSLITQYTMDKWLHTVHAFEEDDWTESGMVWEIVKQPDSYGRLRKIYWKRGYLFSEARSEVELKYSYSGGDVGVSYCSGHTSWNVIWGHRPHDW